jgi:DNA helicase-2/ATP-dependent DNA helicase PcrA
LEQNYRSTQRILDAANSIIENNERRLPKSLYASRELGAGDRLRMNVSYNAEDEAAFVAGRIEDHVRAGERCAVLYRTNAQSRLFEESLRRRGVTYNIVGGFSFYGRAEIRDIVAYLKLALNPHDDVALMRIINTPARGIGKTTLDLVAGRQSDFGVSLWETLAIFVDQRLLSPRAEVAIRSFQDLMRGLSEAATLAVSGSGRYTMAELVKDVCEQTGYIRSLKQENSDEAESRLLNIEELVNAAAESDRKRESLRDFIDHAALASDTDQYRGDADVTLLTMHSAKGLEFPVVFIVGIEEGLLPHVRSTDGLEDIEEERRLCYVAITRAQRHLYLSRATRRRIFGEENQATPSRFLDEIPPHLLEETFGSTAFPGNSPRWNLDQLSDAGTSAAPQKRTSNYRGKTYNNVSGVYEFLQRQARASEPVPANAEQTGEFRRGSRVRHVQYGYGVVLGFEGDGDDTKMTVRFTSYGEKKFIAKSAKLERL